MNGDSVQLAANLGPYALGSGSILTATNIDIHGDFTSPTAPEIDSTAANAVTLLGGTSTVEYLTIVDTANPVAQGTALAFAGKSADRINARGTGLAAGTCYIKAGILRNSLCVATSANGMAVRLDASGVTQTIKLRNVTAYDMLSSANGAISIHDAINKTTFPTAALTATLDNVIAHDPPTTATPPVQPADVVADQTAGAPVTATLTHSNLALTSAGPGTTIDSSDSSNQSATSSPPQFVNPTATAAGSNPAFDFVELAASQTIDHGVTSATDDTPLDLAGNSRVLNGTPDIGAYEFDPAAPPPPPTTTTTTTPPPPPTTTTTPATTTTTTPTTTTTTPPPTTTTTTPTTTTTTPPPTTTTTTTTPPPPPGATRYASPRVPLNTPADAAQCTNAQAPCDVLTAVNVAQNNDTVLLTSGTYVLGSSSVLSAKNIHLRGDTASFPPPEIDSSAGNAVTLSGPSSTIEYLSIVNTSPPLAAGTALAFGGALADRVVARGPGVTGTCYLNGYAFLRDSVCVSTSTGSSGMAVRIDANGLTPTIKLRNVTAYDMSSSTAGAISVHDGLAIAGTKLLTATLDNVIVHDPPTAATQPADVVADTSGSAGATVKVTVSHSNFAKAVAGPGATIDTTTDTNNQNATTSSPVFLNPTAAAANGRPAFDFEEDATSPTIDKGAASLNPSDDGAFDPFGNVRSLGSAPDIGAHEYDGAHPGGVTFPPPPTTSTTTTTTPPPTTSTTTTTPPPTTSTTTTTPPPTTSTTTTTRPPTTSTTIPTPPGDTTPPTLSQISLVPGKFAVTTTHAQNPRISYGALLSYTLSENAHVTGTLVWSRAGRKVGSACKRETKKNKKKRACYMKPVTLSSTLSLNGVAGTNALSFSGKLDGKPLGVGKYQLKLVAKDAAGNSSAATTIAFRIVAG